MIPLRDMLKEVWLRKCLARCPKAALAIRTEDMLQAEARRASFFRAGGGVRCVVCGNQYFDHPPDPGLLEYELIVICDGSRVKL
jgi:hypothetical protein